MSGLYLFCSCELLLVQVEIGTLLFKEFGVIALLNNLSLIQHDDLVRMLNGRQSVCDDDGGAVLRKCDERILDELFCVRIDTRGGLVKDEDLRISNVRAQESQELALAGR